MAVKRILHGKFFNNGQICVAPDYVLCHKDRETELLAALQVVRGARLLASQLLALAHSAFRARAPVALAPILPHTHAHSPPHRHTRAGRPRNVQGAALFAVELCVRTQSIVISPAWASLQSRIAPPDPFRI